LFNPAVEISTAAMLDFAAEHVADRTWIRIVTVAGDLLGNFIDT